MKKLFALFTILLITGILSACTSSEKKDAGMVAGGVVGGLAGHALTGGSTAGTIAGSVGGAYVGRQIAD